eukprot:scaffold48315_cov64-Phaeocystis_antarctica.AAC.3
MDEELDALPLDEGQHGGPLPLDAMPHAPPGEGVGYARPCPPRAAAPSSAAPRSRPRAARSHRWSPRRAPPTEHGARAAARCARAAIPAGARVTSARSRPRASPAPPARSTRSGPAAQPAAARAAPCASPRAPPSAAATPRGRRSAPRCCARRSPSWAAPGEGYAQGWALGYAQGWALVLCRSRAGRHPDRRAVLVKVEPGLIVLPQQLDLLLDLHPRAADAPPTARHLPLQLRRVSEPPLLLPSRLGLHSLPGSGCRHL